MNTKRAWLRKMTTLVALTFLLSFVFIFFRGITWSPNALKTQASSIGVGETTIILYEGQRVWVTRLSKVQRRQLGRYIEFVFQDGGCAFEQIQSSRDSFCMVETQTNQQGVILRFIDEKPNALGEQTPWLGGFINPVNGAVYDLLGRLYKATHKPQTKKYVNLMTLD